MMKKYQTVKMRRNDMSFKAPDISFKARDIFKACDMELPNI